MNIKPKYKINDILTFYNTIKGDKIVKIVRVCKIDEEHCHYHYKTLYRISYYYGMIAYPDHSRIEKDITCAEIALLDGSRHIKKSSRLEKVLFTDIKP